jgi:hypothetical protein
VSSPHTRNGPPPGPARNEISATSSQPDHPQRSASGRQLMAPATAVLAAPIGRHHMWALMVPRCSVCERLHIHRPTGPHGGPRTGGCGAAYRVVVADQCRNVA